MKKIPCIFCRIIAKELPAQVITRYEYTLIISDITPKADIHWLAIPLFHVEDMSSQSTTEQLLGHLFYDATRAVREHSNNSSWKCVVNNGYESGQRVFHLHAHILIGALQPITSL